MSNAQYGAGMDNHKPSQPDRMVAVTDIVGSSVACERFKFDRSTLVRKIASGLLEPLKQLDGDTGAYLFDVNDLPPARTPGDPGNG